MRQVLGGVCAVVLLAACGPSYLEAPSERSSGQRDGDGTVLVFGADFSEIATGPLVSGTTVAVEYAAERLPTCRGEKYGSEAWGITAQYRLNGGEIRDTSVALPGQGFLGQIVLDEPGTLEVWFVNNDVWGCSTWDSNYGANYVFEVAEAAETGPAWMGDVAVVTSRATCDGGPCDGDRVLLDDSFTFGTWTRERAAIAALYFDVWEPGVTDFDNPDLWRQLDARVHWRTDPSADFQWDYVPLQGRHGNNARYEVDLDGLDPVPGHFVVTDPADCPEVPLVLTDDGQYAQGTVELYLTVNGAELRPANGGSYTGVYLNYASLYAPCL